MDRGSETDGGRPTDDSIPPHRTTAVPPCVVFEDDELLVVDKPPGWNTHAPDPYAGEGIHEWLRHREPRWADLSILHRLDKETSGLIVFGKTPLANRSLTRQFEERRVEKVYRLRTDRPIRASEWTADWSLVRAGERQVARPRAAGMEPAETVFRHLSESAGGIDWEAIPKTGRTHQIRAHAAEGGMPILGDRLYGGGEARRLHLVSHRLAFEHPRTGRPVAWTVEPDWSADPRVLLRGAVIAPGETDAFRRLHGSADRGGEGLHLDAWGPFHLLYSDPDAVRCGLEEPGRVAGLAVPDLYHRPLNRRVGCAGTDESGPRRVWGREAPPAFTVRENGVVYEIRFDQGYSVGLFLDQRDNRRRLLTGHVGAGFPPLSLGISAPEVLNCFAYTCAFSVCAALGGARVTSLDLSRKYLDWGRRNFALNALDPAAHDFVFGDTFDWLRRWARRGRRFDAVLLDPPTFSRSKERGDFRAERDYGSLAGLAAGVLRPGGVLFASTNAARLEPGAFLAQVRSGLAAAGRRIVSERYIPQPPDFPVSRDEPAYLKTVWLRLD